MFRWRSLIWNKDLTSYEKEKINKIKNYVTYYKIKVELKIWKIFTSNTIFKCKYQL